MSPTWLVLVLIIVVAGSSFPAILYARRKQWPFATLAAIPFAPATVLELALLTVNSPAQIGFGFLVYPLIFTALGLACLYLVVFLIPYVASSQLRSSIILAVFCVAGIAFGAVAAPWYE